MPSFSPEGNRVAFEWTSEKEDKLHIYFEQIGSGARPVQLTYGQANDVCPVWSPDDRYIAFIRAKESGGVLMLVPSIGGAERRVADLPGYFSCSAWTPDSKWLAISLQESPVDPRSIWLISVNSGERRRLTKPPAGTAGDGWLSISHDGHAIVFSREVGNYAFAPYVLALSSEYRPEGEPREVTSGHYVNIGGTAWTADGGEIVF